MTYANLHVALFEEDGAWFAQGQEIDYLAQGSTPQEAKELFEKGLSATIQQHMRVYGTHTKLLHEAPSDVWNKFAASGSESALLFQDDLLKLLPFDGICYLEGTVSS